MGRRLRDRPIASSALATAIAAIAVFAIAEVTGGHAFSKVFNDIDIGWIWVIAAGELLAYPAYALAYRSLARVHGHAPLALPLVARVVVAGFGPFAVSGGFGIDKQALYALHEDERSARVRVLALGALEWAVLAPATCIAAIVLLASGTDLPQSLLWPWALAVPVGFGFGLWVSGRRRQERVAKILGSQRAWLIDILAGIGVLHVLISHPLRYSQAWLGTLIYWAADIAALYGGLRAFGLAPGLGVLILAYATGYVATRRSLPLGGAGVTEALMTYSLYWLGEPLAQALAAVVAYRAFNFLLAATPALIARHQMQPLLAIAEELRLERRRARRATRTEAEAWSTRILRFLRGLRMPRRLLRGPPRG